MVTETETKTESAPQAVDEGPRPIVSAAHKLLLAIMGAVGIAQDTVEDLLNRMVERGEISQNDARNLVNQLRSWRPHLFQHGVQTPGAEAPATADLISKADIQTLHDQLAALSAALDQLKTELQESPAPAPVKSASAKSTPAKPPSN